MKKLNVKAYAKINLSLDVLGKRPDGYHDVFTVMQQIALHDKICVKWLPDEQPGQNSGIAVEIGSNKAYLPRDGKNLAYKAASLVIGRFEINSRIGSGKVRIDIKKEIPVGAGLGGGSADCAATLRALSEIWELNLSVRELCSLGAELGADVPFCVLSQSGVACALAKGTGTELTRMPGIDSWVVLSKPAGNISTAEAYKGFDLIDDRNYKKPDEEELVAALKSSNLDLIKKNMINVLENFTLKTYPSVAYTKHKMIVDTSPAKAIMSGSGPTVIGLYRNRVSAEVAFDKMSALNEETFLTKTMV
ncbi:MAG: 4-(cytidine 5'-diphospho)-2-C-methyl-D-erythritol kinase [Clostridiales bacterium]|nr:4-(cytidine 5'-diphospho)-2-C-methyl-D-erythritol kinase [Clostridiales bacterium]